MKSSARTTDAAGGAAADAAGWAATMTRRFPGAGVPGLLLLPGLLRLQGAAGWSADGGRNIELAITAA